MFLASRFAILYLHCILLNSCFLDYPCQDAVYFLHARCQCVHAQLDDQSQFVMLRLVSSIFTCAVDDFMSKINGEEGDAFPCEKAGIIADIELMLPEVALEDKSLFPSWLHILSTKVGDVLVNILVVMWFSEQ